MVEHLTVVQKRGISLVMSTLALDFKKNLAGAFQEQMKAEQLNISTLARITKTNRKSVRRLLDCDDTSITLNTIAKTAEALGLEINVTVKRKPLASLASIAGKLAQTNNAKTAAQLKRRFIEGYYGKKTATAI